MSFILGIDPGYTNLGLAVIDTDGPRLVWTDCVTVGVHSRPDLWAKKLWPILESLGQQFAIEGVATETPPYLTPQGSTRKSQKAHLVKTSALLARVSGIIQGWAESRNLPYQEIPPVTLKRTAAALLEVPWDRHFMPKKSEIALCVSGIFGERARTSHENDAALIAYSHARTRQEAA
jgi:Holliday junction resolvasome RuvABC endonuclease subunit